MKRPLFGRKEKNKEKEEVKAAVKEPAKRKPTLEETIESTSDSLDDLLGKYSVELERELIKARVNQQKGVESSSNFAKIGIAYYSIHVIKAAKEKIFDLQSSQDLYDNMVQLTDALKTINKTQGRVGVLNPKALEKQVGKMQKSDTGATADMVRTLSSLSGMDLTRKDSVSVDSLVSVDVIRDLINGKSVDSCLDQDSAFAEDPFRVLREIAGLEETSADTGSVRDERDKSAQDLMDDIDSMLRDISQ